MDPFDVSISARDNAVVVQLRGNATLTTVEGLRDSLRRVLDRRPPKVVLDLAELLFINSLGLGVLLEFRTDLTRAGAKLRLAGARQNILDVLRRTRLAELFPIYPTAEQAVAE